MAAGPAEPLPTDTGPVPGAAAGERDHEDGAGSEDEIEDAIEDEDLVALSSRLRFAVARLARLLRYQDGGSFGATASSALATVNRVGSPTLGELAGHEHVAAPTMSKVVAKLEAAGLVSREIDPSDRRVCRLVMTPAGEQHIEENRSRRTAWLVGELKDLPPGDVARLLAAVDVLESLSNPQARGER